MTPTDAYGILVPKVTFNFRNLLVTRTRERLGSIAEIPCVVS